MLGFLPSMDILGFPCEMQGPSAHTSPNQNDEKLTYAIFYHVRILIRCVVRFGTGISRRETCTNQIINYTRQLLLNISAKFTI